MAEHARNPRQGSKRAKYVDRACRQCKRRKVRCSGAEEDACQQCRSRGVPCDSSMLQQHGHAHTSDPTAVHRSDPVAERTHQPSHSASAAASSNNTIDPRVDGLCDRVKTVEDTLAQLLKSAKGVSAALSPNVSLRNAGDRARVEDGADDDDNDDDDDDDEDTNQFLNGGTPPDDVSLSSQVAAMRALLSRPSSPDPGRRKRDNKAGLVVQLPEPIALQSLFDVYYRDFDCYFPFLDRQDLESRVRSVIHRLGYGAHRSTVVANGQDLSIIALACIMLALAECVDAGEGACDGERKPGWERYTQCRRAMDRLSRSGPLDLDLVRAQCLIAAYLMHVEALQEASHAVTVAWQLATSIRLNDQKVWPKDGSTLQRQQLWWSIYFLDRQISRRGGITYHIRDLEFDVEDFTSNNENTTTTSPVIFNRPSDVAKCYMQGLINLARLWGHVWDTFFAVGALKKGDWMEIEIMDARILNTRRQLPDFLTWDTNEIANYLLMGEDESHIRRRLQIYTRLDLLRLLIRQNPVRRSSFVPETAHLCSRLARQIIVAHDVFVSQWRSARPTGYFTTSSIVECIYHLALVLHNSRDESEHAACVSAFRLAHSVLVRLSSYCKVAEKALRALNGLVRRWGGGHSDGTSAATGGVNDLTENNATSPPFRAGPPGTSYDQFGLDGMDASLGDWMDVPMDSLFGNELDFHFETLLE
ncbi:hypothetical protein DOTSEDRAFT_71540 [Dothistroma septosporum NZE10]|uniref:Zn(2)-C6 fungal-type domain-containing protein n=1 Tax=Dothistroma septosporum (strain NZE10 / CBS 128990) TaxID=675120 RepID=N1PMR8_DOTSN|nr:hypothetical protein DOTSEDRAFT_71540 [Dothistroma septosporum NZE10]